MLTEKMDAVVPALDEERTVGEVVAALRQSDAISTVIVVDNGSTDRTGDVARKAGANVVTCSSRGLGCAVKTGIAHARTTLILKTDADIDNWSSDWLNRLLPLSQERVTRVIFDSPYDSFPVTRLVVDPLLKRLWPHIPPIPLPISGTYVFQPRLFDLGLLRDNWAFDISLLCAAVETGIGLTNVDIGVLSDRNRDMSHNVTIASQILDFFLDRYGRELAG